MTGPISSRLWCAACGRVVGTVPGVAVVNNLLCSDPICQYQGEFSFNRLRDAVIVSAVLEKIAVNQIAFAEGISRQRVYQIIDTWKAGA